MTVALFFFYFFFYFLIIASVFGFSYFFLAVFELASSFLIGEGAFLDVNRRGNL